MHLGNAPRLPPTGRGRPRRGTGAATSASPQDLRDAAVRQSRSAAHLAQREPLAVVEDSDDWHFLPKVLYRADEQRPPFGPLDGPFWVRREVVHHELVQPVLDEPAVHGLQRLHLGARNLSPERAGGPQESPLASSPIQAPSATGRSAPRARIGRAPPAGREGGPCGEVGRSCAACQGWTTESSRSHTFRTRRAGTGRKPRRPPGTCTNPGGLILPIERPGRPGSDPTRCDPHRIRRHSKPGSPARSVPRSRPR
jgi:hypothetical protein